MKLTDWMAQAKLSDAELALEAGVTRSYISRLRTGDVSPTLATALRIQEVTNGEVELEQMLPGHLRPGFTLPARRSAVPPDTSRKQPAPKASTRRASA